MAFEWTQTAGLPTCEVQPVSLGRTCSPTYARPFADCFSACAPLGLLPEAPTDCLCAYPYGLVRFNQPVVSWLRCASRYTSLTASEPWTT